MFRFSIREMMLFTVIVAVSVGWWLDRSRLFASWKAAESESQKAVSALKESATFGSELVDELLKRGVVTSRVRGKTIIGPESAFAP
jgi:hypothetical protein